MHEKRSGTLIYSGTRLSGRSCRKLLLEISAMNLGTGLLSGAFVVDEGALDGQKMCFLVLVEKSFDNIGIEQFPLRVPKCYATNLVLRTRY